MLYDDYMMSVIKFSLLGYLSGIVLYVRVFERMFGSKLLIRFGKAPRNFI